MPRIPAYPSMSAETSRRLAQQFAQFAQNAQKRAERAKNSGDQKAWALHMNNASRLALKAELLGG